MWSLIEETDGWSFEEFQLTGGSHFSGIAVEIRAVKELAKLLLAKFPSKKGELENCVEGIFDHISSAPGNRSTTLGPQQETWLKYAFYKMKISENKFLHLYLSNRVGAPQGVIWEISKLENCN